MKDFKCVVQGGVNHCTLKLVTREEAIALLDQADISKISDRIQLMNLVIDEDHGSFIKAEPTRSPLRNEPVITFNRFIKRPTWVFTVGSKKGSWILNEYVEKFQIV